MYYRFESSGRGIYEVVDKDCLQADERRLNTPDGSWLSTAGPKFPGAISFWNEFGLQKYIISGLAQWHRNVVNTGVFIIQAELKDNLYNDEYQVITEPSFVNVTSQKPFQEFFEEYFNSGKLLLIDKPKHWSSFDVIRKLKRVINVRKLKIGHAGTLDPLATGLLVVCTGKMTKQIDTFQGLPKEYETEFYFGATTQTYDSEFAPQEIKHVENLTKERIETAIREHFIGHINQTPPIYSAIKVAGKRAYDLARKGEVVELKSRTVQIMKFELLEFHPSKEYAYRAAEGEIRYIMPWAKARITCSKGTYIRSLIHDLGQVLDTGAFIHELRRTKIGELDVLDAIPMT
jgi:tRNA pseudouridine55 synthase